MKKILVLLLALSLVFAFAACDTGTTDTADDTTSDADTADDATDDTSSDADTADDSTTDAAGTDVKIGVILIHDENTGYDFAHIEGIQTAAAATGVAEDQIIWKYNIPEDETCYDTATDLVEQGCTCVISDSFGHQDFMMQAAEENPDVTFISMTGVNAAPSGLDNLKNAFNMTFESRYVSGVVAGMKLAELVTDGMVADSNMDADGNIKIGYVGAYPYDEVVSPATQVFILA